MWLHHVRFCSSSYLLVIDFILLGFSASLRGRHFSRDVINYTAIQVHSWVLPNAGHRSKPRTEVMRQSQLAKLLSFLWKQWHVIAKNRKTDGFWASSRNCEKRLLASSCLSVRLSARMEQLSSHWKDFHEILYLRIFRDSVEKVQILLE